MNERPFPRTLSPAAQRIERQKWREYLADLRRLAEVAADGGTLGRDDVFRLQRHLFRGAGAVAFPAPGNRGARLIAEALRDLVQAFVGGEASNRRLAGSIVGLATQLEGVFQDATDAEAAGWRRQFPDD